jgi:hypothetical protein
MGEDHTGCRASFKNTTLPGETPGFFVGTAVVHVRSKQQKALDGGAIQGRV